jgi:hypothetical protein
MGKRKKEPFTSFFEEVFGNSLFEELEGLESFGEGYSISVTSINGKTTVKVNAPKDADVNKIRRELKEKYPDAEIHIEGGRPTIRELETKEVEGSDSKAKDTQKKKPLIRELD